MEEAMEFLSVDATPVAQLDPGSDRSVIDPERVLERISSLVTLVDVERGINDFTSSDIAADAGNTSVLGFIHHSARHYLASSRASLPPYSDQLAEIPAAAHIARVSLTYLAQLDVDLGVEEIMSRFPLARYAAKNWMYSVERCGNQPEHGDVRTLAMALLSTPKLFNLCLSLYNPDSSSSSDLLSTATRSPPPPLYYASLAGLKRIVSDLIDRSGDINAQGGGYGNALQAACARGHFSVAKLLLDRGVEVNAKGGYYGNALQATCANGHESLAQKLISCGADVNAQSGHLDSALQAACERGHEPLVRVLLEAGADVNARGQEQSNALQTACRIGNERLVELLLDHGADANTLREARGEDLLKTAHRRNDQSWVQMVIDRGADLTISDNGGGANEGFQATPTKYEAGLPRILLDKGAEAVTISTAGAATSTSNVVIGAAAVGAVGAIATAAVLLTRLFTVEMPMRDNDQDKANSEQRKAIESELNAIKCELEIRLKLEEETAAAAERGLRQRGRVVAAVAKRCQEQLMRVREKQTQLDEQTEAQNKARQSAKLARKAAKQRKREQAELQARQAEELRECHDDIA